MQASKALVFVVTRRAAKSRWMPWELGYFDGHRGYVVVYPVDKEADKAAQRQEYLSLYPRLPPGSLATEVAKLRALGKVGKPGKADPLNVLGDEAVPELARHIRADMMGPADAVVTQGYAGHIRDLGVQPFDPTAWMNLNNEIWQAWVRLWSDVMRPAPR
jgi:hypothetical protein